MKRESYSETRVRDRRPRAQPNNAWRSRMLGAHLPPMTYKENAACCVAQRDDQGRLPIGFCGPDCVRREERDRRAKLR